MFILLLILIIIIVILALFAKSVKQSYNKSYENFTTSFLSNVSSMFPKKSKALKGYLPTNKHVIQDVQAVDDDLLIYLD